MSTKTTFKRIAFVAVAALTLGSFSAVSASAHQADTLTVSASTSTTTVGTAVSVVLNQSFIATADTDAMTVTASVTSSPATSVALPVLTAAGGTNVNAGTVATTTLVTTTTAVDGTPAAYSTGFTTATLTPAVAGTYVIKFTPAATVGGGILQSAALTWTVTVSAVGAATNVGETTTATADVAVSATRVIDTAVDPAQKGSIVVTSKNAAGVDVTSATILTATISGPGTLGIGTAANVASILPTGRGITGTAGQNTIGVFSDGTSGVATITISAGTTVLATETVTFYGSVASVVATVVNSVIPASNTGASVGAVTAVAYDAAGVVVGDGNLYATSSTSTIISNSYTVGAITSGKASFTLVGVAVGTATITVGTGSSATATTNVAAAPVSVRVGSTTPASVSVTWDKTSYVPGEVAKVSVTVLDSTGLALPNGTYANIFATGGLTPTYALGSASATISGVDVVAATSTGTASYTVFVPDYATSLQLKYTGGTGLPTAAQIAGLSAVVAVEGGQAADAAQAAADAAAEATDAANAATDAANAAAEAADAATAAAQDAADAVAALSTQVSEMINALKKQITALTNLVIKIQKKVKA
jgi:hypothetical protein